MNAQSLSKNHYLLNISVDIKVICQPLEKYVIPFFTHVRCFDDGAVHVLATDKEVMLYHFQQQRPIGPYVPVDMLAKKFHFMASPENADIQFSQAYYEFKEKFKLSYPIYLFERHIGYVDYFHFSSTPDNPHAINFYLNNMDLLESFKLYFKDKAEKLLQKANSHRILLPEHMRLNFKGLTPNDEVSNNLNILKNRTKEINQRLQLHFNTKLTPREIQSLCYLLRGRTALATAQALNISPKTVEFYIDSVKTKLNCLTRADLFDKAWETNLANILAQI